MDSLSCHYYYYYFYPWEELNFSNWRDSEHEASHGERVKRGAEIPECVSAALRYTSRTNKDELSS